MGNFDRHDGLLLTITVTGNTASTNLQTTLPGRQSFVNDFRTMTQDQVAGRFVVEAGPGTTLNRETFSSRTDYRCVCFLRHQATRLSLFEASAYADFSAACYDTNNALINDVLGIIFD